MILMTGGSGLLGRHLKTESYRPSHRWLDITNSNSFLNIKDNKILDEDFSTKDIDMVVHLAAYTNVEKAEVDRKECFNSNVTGTLNLLTAFPNLPFVHISSEYAHNPVNFYSLTKNLAEGLVTYHTAPYLIIRTLFKPRPWPYDKAFGDKWTLGDYVDVIAEKIDKEIANWDRKTSKLIYIGTGRKTYYDLAVETRPEVIRNSIKDVKGVKIPSDYK